LLATSLCNTQGALTSQLIAIIKKKNYCENINKTMPRL